MYPALYLAVLSLLFVSYVSCVASLNVEGNLIFSFPPAEKNIKLKLNGDDYTTISRSDGSFIFYNVPDGIYSLDILSIYHIFPTLKLKISSNETYVSAQVHEYKYPGAKVLKTAYPLVINSIIPVSYFQQTPPFSIIGMLFKNPMILIMLVTVGVMVYFPKMLDAEQMKEFQAQAENQSEIDGDPMKVLNQFLNLNQDQQKED
jgi:hypothetical protein